MKLTIPDFSLIVLIGPSGAGKSTFANTHFHPTEVISSDFCRALVADDENDQSATPDAFDLLHYIAAKRLANGRLTVIDATNVQRESRQSLLNLAREYHCLPVAIVLKLPVSVCHERNQSRPDRNFGTGVIRRQHQQLKQSLRGLKREGFNRIFVLDSEEDISTVTIERQPLWNDRKSEHGPFDIIGDVHGCGDELEQLLETLGYVWQEIENETVTYHRVYTHPAGRKAIFVGDLVDRGPRILDSYQLVRHMVNVGSAYCVPGNHDIKLLRHLRGKRVKVQHGLAETLSELENLPETIRSKFSKEMADFIWSLVSHYVFDNGNLVVAHAGLREEMHGRASGHVREFALYGETSGETDEFGLPIRHNWAAEYRGQSVVVYGHTPAPKAEWLNNTINVDTGCVFGGELTALRYPEQELVSVPAKREYADPIRPLQPATHELTLQQQHDDVLDLSDVTGKRIVHTRLRPKITLREENNIAALEVMSRFAVDPKWLIYLPPTMSPPETSKLPQLLEYPTEAFTYYQKHGISTVICEEKHMGSRAVIIVCRDVDAAQQRFGITDGSIGICYTRTGRRFFEQAVVENALLEQVRTALETADFWQRFNTNWVCLDCELMPWSAKAQGLLQEQYAPVGAAATAAFSAIEDIFQQALTNDVPVSELQKHYQQRSTLSTRYVKAYQQYCWPVKNLSDLKLAPFHILATEGAVHTNRDHLWHMTEITRLATAVTDDCLMSTDHQIVDLSDESSWHAGVIWWEQLTASGGEGMVVKPLEFEAKQKHKLLQPAIKCRGEDYLRIIYGPEYSLPENIERLRQRGVSRKRSLALREFALGVEALERFIRREPIRLVHECVFGVLALESEPVDPRL